MLHFKVIGEGRPVVMMHGVTLDHRHMVEIMEPVFELLAGWQRIYLDLPGHGKSPPQDAIQSQDDILDAVEEFIADKLDETPFALVGLSRGSYIARGIVHRQANRVQGAALIVPGVTLVHPILCQSTKFLNLIQPSFPNCRKTKSGLLKTFRSFNAGTSWTKGGRY